MGPFFETADCPVSGKGIDAFNALKNQSLEIASTQVKDMVSGTLLNAAAWLEAASAPYHISPKMSDYVLVPTPILYSDIPNRNMVSFPYTELTAFNPDTGDFCYKSWKGKPTHLEHQNSDITKAKGIIFDVAMRPVKGFKGEYAKVITLLGFDRTKDPVLANAILSGARNTFSMGATVNDYRCSICNASMAKSGGRCDHIDITSPNTKLMVREFGGKLAYRMGSGCLTGIETSAVGYPAWNMATSNRAK